MDQLGMAMKREIDVDYPADLVGAFISSAANPPASTSTFSPTKISNQAFSTAHLEHSYSSQTSGEEFSCVACGYEIRERYLLRVMDDFWHEMCLRCFTCDRTLSEKDTCFVKDGRVYCKEDHSQLFSAKCARCHGTLQPTDFVFRCMQNTYHAGCFSCVYCNQPLKKGDQYFFVEGQTICQQDYSLIICNQMPPVPLPDAPYGPISGFYDMDAVDVNRKTPKRPRTILNSQQRKAFKYAFEKSAKPSRKVREQLAKETGLSVRVVQVWFQNQRAKIKKQQRKQEDSKPNGVHSTDSEGKSLDDSKSTCDSLKSDEEIDSDAEEFDLENVVEEREKSSELKDYTPIEKLCNMQAVYFNCA
ncbi:hypothetical protein L596_015516 [Steinernema carpocapsae]|uniref:Uncharacterized protein n=1 Tax=Steinernema carpocapsae TaxID=34508 RepID=A0A4U5NFV0_STECR|nr:hypothetical protein L596_015516 [Steinernema carpocapsae]